MAKRDKRVLYLGEGEGDLGFWAHCMICGDEVCVYRSNTPEGQLEADDVIENKERWLYADGAWICPICTGVATPAAQDIIYANPRNSSKANAPSQLFSSETRPGEGL